METYVDATGREILKLVKRKVLPLVYRFDFTKITYRELGNFIKPYVDAYLSSDNLKKGC